MKPKFALIATLFFALMVVAPISASAERHRVHFYFSYGAQPSYYYYQPVPNYYYYEPAPTYYYQPAPAYSFYYQSAPRYRTYRWEARGHWDRGRHRGWYKDRD